jgi:hypothetical protein
MTTHTANHTLRFETSLVRAAFVQRPLAPQRAPAKTAAQPDWLERLAAWAERQPMHHHLGSWMLQR